MFQRNFVEKKKTHILCSITFFPKAVPFTRQRGKTWWSQTATDELITGRMRFACFITKATHARTQNM
jgi:hypothetical protein